MYEELTKKTLKRSTSSWNFFFNLLCRYIEHEGHSLVPMQYITNDGYNLGTWVAYQRQSYKNRKLSLERQKRLEQLSEWVWDRSDAIWQKGFEYLKQYAEYYGNTKVPIRYFTKDNYNLGTWVAYQHKAYRTGKLSEIHQHKLEKLSGWVWRQRSICWNDQTRVFLKKLSEYAELKGHTFIPLDYFTKDNYGLGKWVFNQRKAYQKKLLNKDQVRCLENIPGWSWNINTNKQNCRSKRNDEIWQKGYKQLIKYIEREGHANVPSKYVTKQNFKLGIWIQNQRSSYKKRTISIERQKALESLSTWKWELRKEKAPNKSSNKRSAYKKGFLIIKRQEALESLSTWKWEPRKEKASNKSNNKKTKNTIYDKMWQKGYQHLTKYVKKEGHVNIPVKYVTKDGYNLGHWACMQRVLYKQDNLAEKRKKLLEQIPTWTWDKHAARWNEGYIHLLKYIGTHKNSLVPKRYVTNNNYKLGIWVMYQRERYKHKRLPLKYKKSLERLPNWMWEPRKDKKYVIQKINKVWQNSFNHLKNYIEHNGHACVPSNYVNNDGYKLGTWIRDQRYEKKKGRLSQEQQKMLENLPGWIWDARSNIKKTNSVVWENKWKLGYKYLQAFVLSKGHSKVPSYYITNDGYKLGIWVRDQRYKKKKGQLPKKRQEILENSPGWTWNAIIDRNQANSIRASKKWELGIKYMKDFVKNEGHANVPCNYITNDGYKLGAWVSRQRQYYKQKILSDKRIMVLEKDPHWIWEGNRGGSKSNSVKNSTKWELGYDYLKAFIASEGHAKVPSLYVNEAGYKLGLWVTIQRQNHKNKKLSDYRIQSLEKLPGWVWRIRNNQK